MTLMDSLKDASEHRIIVRKSSPISPPQGQQSTTFTPGTTMEDSDNSTTNAFGHTSTLEEESLDSCGLAVPDNNEGSFDLVLAFDSCQVGEDPAWTNVVELLMGIAQRVSAAPASDEIELMIHQCYIQLCQRRATELPYCAIPNDNAILGVGEMILKPPREGGQAQILGSLGTALEERFEVSQNQDDLNWAITCYEKAALLTDDANKKLPYILTYLGHTLSLRFRMQWGDDSDIDQAISCHERTVSLTTGGYPSLMTERLYNLATSCNLRFEARGEQPDIQLAIVCYKQAIGFSPKDHYLNHLLRANLGTSFLRKFEITGDPEDIDQAIIHLQGALLSCPKDYDHRTGWLSNLGLSYVRRFEGFGTLADIDQAIEYQTQSIESTSQDDPYLPELLVNLGISYTYRFARSGQMPDIEKALELHNQAASLIPDGHSGQPGCLDALADALVCRYDRAASVDIYKTIFFSWWLLSAQETGRQNNYCLPPELPRRQALGPGDTRRSRRLPGAPGRQGKIKMGYS